MNLKNRKVLVVGLAKTGVAVARFLKKRGAHVTVTDLKNKDELGAYAEEVLAMGISLSLGAHETQHFMNSDLIVLSPGVPHTITPLDTAREAGIPVIGEIELASRHIAEPMVAVTGTNGKTTTTSLIGEMLKASGQKVFVGGNIGAPLIDYVETGMQADTIVAEISSFQLDTIEHFRPEVGLLLNITEDHLDRYDDFEHYVQSKGRLFENQERAPTWRSSTHKTRLSPGWKGTLPANASISMPSKPLTVPWSGTKKWCATFQGKLLLSLVWRALG